MPIGKASDLNGVQQTLLLPLWGRAQESLSSEPLLHDPLAVSIAHDLPGDLALLFEGLSRVSRESWIARSVYFDEKSTEFLARHPNGTIVDIGCGLDTTFERVDNGHVRWFDLDFAEVIAVRRKYVQENDRRRFIAGSILDPAWLSHIPTSAPVFFIMAGVIYYFTTADIQATFARLSEYFGDVEVVFDYCSDVGLRMANKRVLEQTDMHETARLTWSANNIRDIERLHRDLHVIDNGPLFREHRKRLPLMRRIGPLVSDMMGIMSLAHIELGTRNGA